VPQKPNQLHSNANYKRKISDNRNTFGQIAETENKHEGATYK
jgi:hypothetical protein